MILMYKNKHYNNLLTNKIQNYKKMIFLRKMMEIKIIYNQIIFNIKITQMKIFEEK